MAAIVDSSHDAIVSSSLDGNITSWNPAAHRMDGYSSAEIIGKHAATLAPTDRTGEVKDLLEKIKAGHHLEYFETNHVRKDATVFPVSLTISPAGNEKGNVVGASVICPRRERAEACRSVRQEPDPGRPGPGGDDQPGRQDQRRQPGRGRSHRRIPQ